MSKFVLCRSDTGDGGWSLHAPSSTDEEIGNGDAPVLVSGPAEYDLKTEAWSRPNADDYAAAERAFSPHAAALPIGSVMVLGQGNLAAATHAAIRAAGGEEAGADFDVDEIGRLISEAQIGAGLRAEAGYSSPVNVIFHTWVARLANHQQIYRWLILGRTPAGDAVRWNVALRGKSDDCVIACAHRQGAEELVKMLALAGGGFLMDEVESYPARVPTEAQLRDMDQ